MHFEIKSRTFYFLTCFCRFYVPIICSNQGRTKWRNCRLTTKKPDYQLGSQLDTHKPIFILCTEISNNLNCFIILTVHLTSISTKLGFWGDFSPLKLKICSLYHEILIFQKFSDIFTQVLKPLTPWRLIEVNYIPLYESCRFKFYCCTVGIETKAQQIYYSCNRVAFVVLTMLLLKTI